MNVLNILIKTFHFIYFEHLHRCGVLKDVRFIGQPCRCCNWQPYNKCTCDRTVLQNCQITEITTFNNLLPGQPSLLPSVGRVMRTGQSAVMRCGWGVKAGWLIPFVDRRVGNR